jgi:hypothetical protein
MRWNLAVRYSRKVADEFLPLWDDHAQEAFDHYWDLRCIVDVLPIHHFAGANFVTALEGIL